MHIGISIVSHAQSALVKTLLASLDEHVYSREHKVSLIITENTLARDEFNCKFPLLYKQNLHCKGFGANHNSAFEYLDPDIFLILNPDIEFIEDFDLDLLVNIINASQVGVTSPIILDKNGVLEDYKRSDLTLKNLFKRKFLKYPDSKFDWYAGMFLIVTRPVFRSLGGFDPRFFMYVEDCDFCMRAAQNGYIVADTTNISVKHDARRNSQKLFSKHAYWHVQSLLKYWMKNIRGSQANN